MLETILSKENIQEAMGDLLTKSDRCGVDGVKVSAFADYWKINGERILQDVRDGDYAPSPVKKIEILKPNGKKRYISQFTCTDRVLLRAMKSASVLKN
jgi:RNA-directed DNA polymerase